MFKTRAFICFVLLSLTAVAICRAQEGSIKVVSRWADGIVHAIDVRDTLLVTNSTSAIVLLNATDPAELHEISQISGPVNSPRDILLRGNHAFVAGGPEGVGQPILASIDLSNPYAPDIGDVVSAEDAETAYHVRLRGDTAFLPADPGLVLSRMYDVSDPLAIQDIGTFGAIAMDVAFAENALYQMTANGAYQKRVASWSPLDYESVEKFGESEWIQAGEVLNGNLYMVGDRLHIYDVSSESGLPVRLGDLDIRRHDSGCHPNLTLANGLIYVTGSAEGLLVIDAAEPSNPRIVAQFETACATDVAVTDGLIFLAAGDEGLFVLRDESESWRATASEATNELPVSSRLESLYPNPSSGAVHVRYKLARPGKVRLHVYDLLGRRVESIDGGTRSAGRHEMTWQGIDASAGTYVIQLEMEDVRRAGFIQIMR